MCDGPGVDKGTSTCKGVRTVDVSWKPLRFLRPSMNSGHMFSKDDVMGVVVGVKVGACVWKDHTCNSEGVVDRWRGEDNGEHGNNSGGYETGGGVGEGFVGLG